MKSTVEEGTILWQPTQKQIEQANLTRFMHWLAETKELHFDSYDDLYIWSVTETETFWEIITEYFKVRFSTPYENVLKSDEMPGAEWFPGGELNFTEYVFGMQNKAPALLFQSEIQRLTEISWDTLRAKTQALSGWLKENGVKKGDRVAAYIPNIPEAFTGALASASIGAIWSACSPDFGTESVYERFSQIEPKVLITVDGYRYGGKKHDRVHRVTELLKKLPTVEKVILIPYLNRDVRPYSLITDKKVVLWNDVISKEYPELEFEPVSFSHPLWVLYSSGTTGLPKSIVHSHGGILLEHLKYMEFHADVRKGDRFFWYSTTGWMMWNVVLSALLRGATALVYDGSPGYPDMNVLWRFAQDTRMTCFGTSATYIVNCMKEGLTPAKDFDLSDLRSVGSTGSPLPPEGFQWVYEHVGNDIMLNSTSGGTDICSSFVGGSPILPVYAGEIQCRILGSAVESFNEAGEPLIDEVGEMVITKPLPSMPVFFWGDTGHKRYTESYFEMYSGVWRHGDWLKITKRGTCVIYGRSDATLNKMGVRIGTSEIYRAVESCPGIKNSLIVSLELRNGDWYMPLFVQLKKRSRLNEELITKIRTNIRERISPRFLPDEIVEIKEIPYTLSGKKMEKPVKKILEGKSPEKAASRDSMKNPEILQFFENFAKTKVPK